MQFTDISNNKSVVEATQKLGAFQGLIYVAVVVLLYGAYSYLFYQNIQALESPAKAFEVPLSQDMQSLKANIGLSFDGAEILRKNIENLKDNSEQIVGGVKGRSNPFDSYAATRSTR